MDIETFLRQFISVTKVSLDFPYAKFVYFYIKAYITYLYLVYEHVPILIYVGTF